MAAVALDADVLIAFLDPSDAQHERAVSELRSRMAAGEQLLVGASVYAEVMVRPLERGTDAKVDEFLAAAKIDRTECSDASSNGTPACPRSSSRRPPDWTVREGRPVRAVGLRFDAGRDSA